MRDTTGSLSPLRKTNHSPTTFTCTLSLGNKRSARIAPAFVTMEFSRSMCRAVFYVTIHLSKAKLKRELNNNTNKSMPLIYLYAVASVVIVSVVSFVGVLTLSLQDYLLKKYVFVLVSLAVGALLGDALIHLLPEAFETAQNPVSVPLLVIGGVLIFFIFE